MTTTSAHITTEAHDQLAAALRGQLIMPGDPGYDEARAVYNGMIDKHPAAIARCLSTTVDPENHIVRADAGCTWGDVDHATVAFGMAPRPASWRPPAWPA